MGVFLYVLQSFELILLSIGLGYWFSLLAGKTKNNLSDRLICLICGFSLSVIILQNLVYCNIRLLFAGPLVMSFALVGLFFEIKKSVLRLKTFILHIGYRKKPLAKALIILGALLIVYVVESLPVISKGVNDYYGNAHQDQVNYVQIAEFFIEKPFYTSYADIGLHPWMVKGVDFKNQRLGASIANGSLAVLSGVDAKQAYGALITFYILLAGLGVYVLARILGLGNYASIFSALWASLLPIITRIHLDGFLSQVAVGFVIPALIYNALSIKRHPRFSLVSLVTLLSYLLVTYTEIYPIAVLLVACVGSVSLFPRNTRRILDLAISIMVSLILVPRYLFYVFTWVIEQYATISSGPNKNLDGLFPNSGTLLGWAELFLPVQIGHWSNTLNWWVLLSLFILGLIIVSLVSQSKRRFFTTLSIFIVPLVVLGLLYIRKPFSPYPFAKLLAIFSPMFVVLAVLGLTQLLRYLRAFIIQKRVTRFDWLTLDVSVAVGVSPFIILALIGSITYIQSVLANELNLMEVDSVGARRAYHFIESHPNSVFVVNEQNPIVCAWICYHGRNSDIYLDSKQIGDRLINSDKFKFLYNESLDLINTRKDIWQINGNRYFSLNDPDVSPDIKIINKQGLEKMRDGSEYAWVAESIDIKITNFSKRSVNYILNFSVSPGPANKDPHRSIILNEKKGKGFGTLGKWSFTGIEKIHVRLTLNPGNNWYKLSLVDNPQWTEHISSDPRNLMLMVRDLSLTKQ